MSKNRALTDYPIYELLRVNQSFKAYICCSILEN